MDLSSWFDPEVVFNKRSEIAKLMREMILEQNELPIELPNIIFFKELDPELQVPVVDSASQSASQSLNDNNGNGNVLFDENGNGNDENGNDENGNNNESAFNNNNDFYEVDHNVAVNANVTANSQEQLQLSQPMITDPLELEEGQRSPIVSAQANNDGCDMTDDEDDPPVSHNLVISDTRSLSDSQLEADRKNLASLTSGNADDDVIELDDSDEDSPMQEALKPDDDEDMTDASKSTPETTNDSQVTGNQL